LRPLPGMTGNATIGQAEAVAEGRRAGLEWGTVGRASGSLGPLGGTGMVVCCRRPSHNRG